MQYLTFEFDNEQDLEQVIRRLWDQMGVTGELASRPLAGGRWRLEVQSEKDLRESTLEKLKQWRVEVGD